jgi:monoamine oxidase
MLRQLATKGSAHKLSLDEDTVEKKPTTSTIHDLPLFKGLVTTTLTTLNTRLMNECDRTLSMLLLSNPSASAVTTAQEQLTSMIADLYKMTEMVNWEQQEQMKYQVKDGIQQLEKTISKEELNIITVKDIVSRISRKKQPFFIYILLHRSLP